MIEARFNVFRSRGRRARLSRKLNTAIQQQPLEQLTGLEGESTGTHIHCDAIED